MSASVHLVHPSRVHRRITRLTTLFADALADTYAATFVQIARSRFPNCPYLLAHGALDGANYNGTDTVYALSLPAASSVPITPGHATIEQPTQSS